MMTDDERRKVFWLLKKYSSYTAWKALADAYFAFADAWMAALRKAADEDIDDFNQNATKNILNGRIAFENGIARLKTGDRAVWRMSDQKSLAAWGPLARACNELDFVHRIMDPREYVFDWMKNRDEVFARFRELEFWSTCAGATNERGDLTKAAPLSPWNALATVHPDYGVPLNDPKYLNFPSRLPDVPSPAAIAVRTGSEVPANGIYEPEWGEAQPETSNLFGKLKAAVVPSLYERPEAESAPRLQHVGCMNYLLAQTVAPPYRDRESDPPMPVTWRLIWKDERYLDGTIPEEEAQYLAPVEPSPSEHLRCEGGQPCPREGFWFSPAKTGSRRRFEQGEPMPILTTDWGSTIWQWDQHQSN